MSGYGDIPLAACGIVLKAERIPLNIGIGICQGMMPIIAYNYSSGNYKRMKEIMRVARIAGLVIAIISVAFYELSAPQLIHLFINHEETSRLGSNFLMARALATPFSFANLPTSRNSDFRQRREPPFLVFVGTKTLFARYVFLSTVHFEQSISTAS